MCQTGPRVVALAQRRCLELTVGGRASLGLLILVELIASAVRRRELTYCQWHCTVTLNLKCAGSVAVPASSLSGTLAHTGIHVPAPHTHTNAECHWQ